MAKVLNKRRDKIPPDAVYVGRPTKFGNPYKVAIKGHHQAAVDLFRSYLMECPLLIEDVKAELRGKDLVCWCHPLPCHADVLLEIANS